MPRPARSLFNEGITDRLRSIMTKKRLDTAKQNRTKPNAGTEDRTGKAGSARKPTPPAAPRHRVANALYVTGYQAFREMPDDVRKGRSGPARYIKRPVSLSPFCSDEESLYFERMRALKARPERHLLSTLYDDIL